MNYQQHLANSAAIRAEIQRFESVHPNIYSIYELLEQVDEPQLQNQIREHVIAIEGRTRGGCCGLGRAGLCWAVRLSDALQTVTLVRLQGSVREAQTVFNRVSWWA